MTKFACLGLFPLLFPVTAFSQDSPNYRTWTDARGRQAELAFIDFADGQLRIQDRSGKEFRLALNAFSEQDQKRFLDEQVERALTLSANNRKSEASELLETLTKVAPRYAPAVIWLAKSQASSGDTESAIESYKSYARLNPTDVEGPLNIARLLQQKGQSELAIFWFKRALEIDPNNASVNAEMNVAAGIPGSLPQQPAVESHDLGRPDSIARGSSGRNAR